ncbi:META domain-containing protein [Corynebacterium heidelbergense]|uniref:META domain-containing protein n=1 Tax=Corynebacterium heidelbergense TaxID=2055947 RepID=UPI001057C0C0|nr:META domain-containing protein [Corynebacterium heidelbergense]
MGTARARSAGWFPAACCAAVVLPFLAACGSGESPIGNTQWQVTSIFTDATRPHILPDTQQGRVFLVFEQDAFTGASGCFNISGKARFNRDASEVAVSQVRTEQLPEQSRCQPGDEDSANRLRAVLDGHSMRIERPGEGRLRLAQVQPDAQPWQAPGAIEMIDR